MAIITNTVDTKKPYVPGLRYVVSQIGPQHPYNVRVVVDPDDPLTRLYPLFDETFTLDFPATVTVTKQGLLVTARNEMECRWAQSQILNRIACQLGLFSNEVRKQPEPSKPKPKELQNEFAILMELDQGRKELVIAKVRRWGWF